MDAADERHDEVGRALVYQRDARISPEEGARLRATADADRLREQISEWKRIERSGALDRPGSFAAEYPPPPYLRRRVPVSIQRPVVRLLAPSSPSPRCGARRRERRSASGKTSRGSPGRRRDRDDPDPLAHPEAVA